LHTPNCGRKKKGRHGAELKMKKMEEEEKGGGLGGADSAELLKEKVKK
jgi:hypothetical protein